jgi:hypothetical protein
MKPFSDNVNDAQGHMLIYAVQYYIFPCGSKAAKANPLCTLRQNFDI